MDYSHAEVEIKPQLKSRGSVAKEEYPKPSHWLYKLQNKSTRSTRQTLSMDGESNGNPLQYSCLVNPVDGGAW